MDSGQLSESHERTSRRKASSSAKISTLHRRYVDKQKGRKLTNARRLEPTLGIKLFQVPEVPIKNLGATIKILRRN